MAAEPSEIIHATCVSLDGSGTLIMGASGSGKSSLALQLIAYGAQLVSDDRTILTASGTRLMASCPDTIAGLIEARGVGILRLPHQHRTRIEFIVDLDSPEHKRLPEPHCKTLMGVTLPCLWHAPSAHFAVAVLQYMRGGVPLAP